MMDYRMEAAQRILDGFAKESISAKDAIVTLSIALMLLQTDDQDYADSLKKELTPWPPSCHKTS